MTIKIATKWTLESARRDYNRKPNCSKCKFSSIVEQFDGFKWESILNCQVKDRKILDSEKGQKCKYYTYREE